MNQHDQMREAASLMQKIRAYGYAPGNYSGTCGKCRKQMNWVDKCAVYCMPCALEKMEKNEQALAHVNETPKNEHDSDDVLNKAGNVDMMREALRNNIRGFLCERTGMFKFVLSDAECHEGWKEMMLIPNLPNEVIDSVLAAEPAPLVRLERRDIMKICQEAELEYRHGGHRNMADIVAVKVMDAMEEKNK